MRGRADPGGILQGPNKGSQPYTGFDFRRLAPSQNLPPIGSNDPMVLLPGEADFPTPSEFSSDDSETDHWGQPKKKKPKKEKPKEDLRYALLKYGLKIDNDKRDLV